MEGRGIRDGQQLFESQLMLRSLRFMKNISISCLIFIRQSKPNGISISVQYQNHFLPFQMRQVLSFATTIIVSTAVA